MDDPNSSDWEFEDNNTAKGPVRYPGQKSIARIIEDAQQDRFNSKRTVKQLQYGRGVAGTKYAQSLWATRFEAFRANVLKEDIHQSFDGDTLIRFFDSILSNGKMKRHSYDKPAPNLTTIHSAVAFLVGYGTFHWGDRQFLSSRDKERLATFLDDATRQGRLTRGRWHKRTWACFVTVSCMIQRFLDYHHENGCWNWDVIIYKCLSIVLTTALGARCGDVGLSNQYKGCEFLAWKRIRIMLEGDPLFANLTMEIVLEFEKLHKDSRNEETTFYFKPLEDSACRHMCPIHLLLVHALRHGLVEATRLDELLFKMHETPTKPLAWKFPDYPVLSAISNTVPYQCVTEKAATTNQLHITIKHMGLLSNILEKIHMHATRSGSARNKAHLPSAVGEEAGFVTGVTRQAMGHSSNPAESTQLTEHYAGGHSALIYNAIAQNKDKRHRREAKFGTGSAIDEVRATVTEEEMQSWHKRHAEDEKGLSEEPAVRKRRARAGVQRERLENYKENAVPIANPYKDINGGLGVSRTPLAPRSSNTMNLQLQQRLPQPSPPASMVDDANIDPRLKSSDSSILPQGDGSSDIEVDESAFNSLHAMMFPQNDENGNLPEIDDDPSGTTTLHEDAEEAARLLTSSYALKNTAETWIDYYSRINIISNNGFPGPWHAREKDPKAFQEALAQRSTSGNSRDDPTPLVHHCVKTPNCPFQTYFPTALRKHEKICTEGSVAAQEQATSAERFVCDEPGCGAEFASRSGLKGHRRSFHQWTPRKCDDCPDDERLFPTLRTYTKHRDTKHSLTNRFPTSCRYPGCSSSKQFSTLDSLRRHLRDEHQVSDNETITAYSPPVISLRWVTQTCPLGCSDTFQAKDQLQDHMTLAHQMTEQDARLFVKEKASYKRVEKPSKVRKPAARLTKYKASESSKTSTRNLLGQSMES